MIVVTNKQDSKQVSNNVVGNKQHTQSIVHKIKSHIQINSIDKKELKDTLSFCLCSLLFALVIKWVYFI